MASTLCFTVRGALIAVLAASLSQSGEAAQAALQVASAAAAPQPAAFLQKPVSATDAAAAAVAAAHAAAAAAMAAAESSQVHLMGLPPPEPSVTYHSHVAPQRFAATPSLTVLPSPQQRQALLQAPPPLALGQTSANLDNVDAVAKVVARRIVQDSQRIGVIDNNLEDVQSEFNAVQQQVMAKVFNMESFARYASSHNYSAAEHERLNQEMELLKPEVNHLNMQLMQVTAFSDEQYARYQAGTARLHRIDVKDFQDVQKLEQWVNWLKAVEQQVKKLEDANAELKEQQLQSAQYVTTATAELDRMHKALSDEYLSAVQLHSLIMQQHDYASGCRGADHRLTTALFGMQGSREKEHDNAIALNSRHKGKQQTLKAQNAIVLSRYQKGNRNSDTINAGIAQTKERMEQLQQQGEMQLAQLRSELGGLRQQSSAIESQLMQRETARQMVELNEQAAQGQVSEMKGALSSGELASLKANNTRLHAELPPLKMALGESQTAEQTAQMDLVEAKREEADATQESVEATEKSQAVARDALAKVAEVEKSSQEETDKAAAATLEAEASLTVECSALWDRSHAEMVEKLDGECQRVQQDVDTQNALLATLQTAVQAERNMNMAA